MRRGDIYDASLNPTIGSEQAGARPVVIVSRSALNEVRPLVVVIPLASARPRRIVHPGWARIRAGESGLGNDSLALCEQIRGIDKSRLRRYRGHLSKSAMAAL